jgi:hypothetical protein
MKKITGEKINIFYQENNYYLHTTASGKSNILNKPDCIEILKQGIGH